MDIYDIAIVGAGPGGLACAIKAQELGLSYILLEKGKRIMQGIIDSYPRGKKVYPTIPKGETEPFPIDDLEPNPENEPIEEYLSKVEASVEKYEIPVHLKEEFQDIVKERNQFTIVTTKDRYRARGVILAFGSNIPGDLGIYGEARTVARNLDNPEEYVGAPTLVLGGGNAAADVVATMSKTKRFTGATEDNTSRWTRMWPGISGRKFSLEGISEFFKGLSLKSVGWMKTALKGLSSKHRKLMWAKGLSCIRA
jgi:thioredoxin reductase